MKNPNQAIPASLSNVKQTNIILELLDINERPIGRVEGEVISGSISIDGDSAVRRTLNLNFLTTDKNYKILETSNSISINKKIKVYVKIKDLDNYKENKEEFCCGTYVMSKCSSSASIQGQQITVTAQDKMCLHNGEIAGALEYTTRIDSEYITPSYNNYITNLQNTYNSLVSDLNNKSIYITTILSNLNSIYIEVEGENSLLESTVVTLMTLSNKILVTSNDEVEDLLQELSESISSLYVNSKMKKLTIYEIIKYAAISLAGELPGKVIINDVPDKVKTPILLQDGETIGYKMIKYIYPEELTLTTGQPVSVIYEQCKQALGGNFEYFYDVEGNFIFQEIKNYLNNTIPPLEDLKTSNYKYSFDKTPIQFDFSQHEISTSYNSTPNWNNIKNDFYVWGTNEEQLIGYHIVIDDKPSIPLNVIDATNKNGIMDWREYIIHNQDIGINNSFVGKCYLNNINEMDNSKVGNVCCLVDSSLNIPQYRVWNGTSWVTFSLSEVTTSIIIPEYYLELKSIWKPDHYKDNYELKDSSTYSFNFDIIEGDKDLSKFSVKTIGRRKCPIEDENVRQLYPTIIEDILVYYNEEDLQYTSSPENAIKLNSIDEFKIYKAAGNIYKDAFSRIKELLFQYTTYNEQLQLTSLPIYDLEVNRRCYIYFEKTNTSGFFLTKKISYNLDENGLMTTSAIKTEKRDN